MKKVKNNDFTIFGNTTINKKDMTMTWLRTNFLTKWIFLFKIFKHFTHQGTESTKFVDANFGYFLFYLVNSNRETIFVRPTLMVPVRRFPQHHNLNGHRFGTGSVDIVVISLVFRLKNHKMRTFCSSI